MFEPRVIAMCLIASLVLPATTCSRSHAQDLARAALLLASRYEGTKTALEIAPVGKPVLVSRFDTEASVTRVRSVEILKDSGEPPPSTPNADPAFKAVFLTPRGSTGRPVPIQMATLAQPAEEAESADKAHKPTAPAPSSAAIISQEKVVTKPTPGPSSSRSASVPKSDGLRPSRTRSAEAKAAPPRPRVASPERSSYGAAEIGASRAFTRF
ncbi:hypothetical protein CI1B_76310 [Bradyrhizobium ivorense]|uniref:Uncharacterized protein n=1 Tax=Bradyrhizobium ivorense TaxID=2511166 RepID=A0A508TY10_9BRAD|nr:hypothetical protein CI1B_76310 [Bradyrhizobium ivorense]